MPIDSFKTVTLGGSITPTYNTYLGTADGNATVLAAVAGSYYRFYGFVISSADSCRLDLRENTTTRILLRLGAFSPFVINLSDYPLDFAANTPLTYQALNGFQELIITSIYDLIEV